MWSLDAFLNNASCVGRMFVNGTGKPMDILTKLNELAGFAPDEEIELFEVNILFIILWNFINFQDTFRFWNCAS